MSPATIRQRAQARERRSRNEQAILEAAESLLVGRSFHELTVEDVMTAAGLSRTAFYRYFPDLQAVLLRRMADIAGELQEACGKWLDPSADPERGLFVGACELAEVYQRHGPLLSAFADAASSSPDVAAAWRATIEGFVGPVIARITGLELVVGVDVDQLARALVWLVERYLLETYGRGPGLPTEVAAETLSFIWRRTLFSSRP